MENKLANLFSDLLSLVNVNDYIQSQLIYMQLSPQNMLPYDEICQLCEFVRKNFSRIPTLHLLEMLNEVRVGDYAKANDAVQLFFDWIVTHRFDKCDPSMISNLDIEQRVLKYALILRSRLALRFGYIGRANRYIIEAIQKAQANDDLMCLRLALVVEAEISLAALQLALNQNLTQHTQGFSYENCFNRLNDLALQQESTTESFRTTLDSKHLYDFTLECRLIMNLIKAIYLIIKCEHLDRANTNLRECLNANFGVDRLIYGRMIQDVARSIQSTLQLMLGFSSSSNVLAKNFFRFKLSTYTTNLDSSYIYDTESHHFKIQLAKHLDKSILWMKSDVCKNAQVLKGLDYFVTFCIIDELKQRFSIGKYTLGAMHWRLAEACIGFDRCIFSGNFVKAMSILEEHETHYEMKIRKAILYGIRGNLKLMQETIESISETLNSFNIFIRIRTLLVLAQLYFISGTSTHALDTLNAVLALAKTHKLVNFIPIILRRLLTVQVF